MNTLKLNVQELSSNDAMEIEGGIAPLIIYGGCLLVGIAVGAAARYFATR